MTYLLSLIIPVDQEYPTPKPHIKTFISGVITFSLIPSFKAIGMVEEVVFPLPCNDIKNLLSEIPNLF